MSQYVAICRNMSQYVAICRNMSQYVAIWIRNICAEIWCSYENALCLHALTERWSHKLIFNSFHLPEMHSQRQKKGKKKNTNHVSWSKTWVGAAVSQNPMLYRNFPTFECHWLCGITAILGLLIVVLRHGHVGGCNPDHLISRKAVQYWNLSKRIES